MRVSDLLRAGRADATGGGLKGSEGAEQFVTYGGREGGTLDVEDQMVGSDSVDSLTNRRLKRSYLQI